MTAKPTGKAYQQTPQETRATPTERRGQAPVGRFLRSLQILLRSARFYQKNHPLVLQSLEAAESELRVAFGLVSPLIVSVERDRLLFHGHPLPDSRGELKALADDLFRQGVATLALLPETHLGELGTLAELLAGTPAKPGQAPMKSGEQARPRGAGRADPAANLDWAAVLNQHGIRGIHINALPEQKKADTALTNLITALLESELQAWVREAAPATGGADPGATRAQPEAYAATAPAVASTLDELLAALRLGTKIAAPLRESDKRTPQQAVRTLRGVLAETDRRALMILVAAMSGQAPRGDEALEPYLGRLAEMLALEFVVAQFRAGRVKASELRDLFARIGRELFSADGFSQSLGRDDLRAANMQWTDEAYAEHLHRAFWTRLTTQERGGALRSGDAWCVPLNSLRLHLEQLVGAGAEREARSLLLSYARGLESQLVAARLAAATGLSELGQLIEEFWPEQLPQELTQSVVRALVAEEAPEVASVLAAVTDHLAGVALDRADYAEFEHILNALAECPRDAEHAHLARLAQRLLQEARWQKLAEPALAHRPLAPALPRILGRDPERLLDQMSLLLAGPQGLEGLPAMVRLLRAIGEPVAGALVTRLFDPRTQRAMAAVKLLAATWPERLMAELPRSLPSWDWNLQDLAVSELVSARGGGLPGCARVLLEVLPHAHPLVVPMILDEMGLAKEATALPFLLEIAAGQNERLKDIFVRIKAIEALGRMGAQEAAELLRTILRQRSGLAHAEPAGLRAAAEDALALIENRPSSARVRAAHQATEKASVSYTRPRRYLRIPLESPLAARIDRPAPLAARVKTISLGGAFLEVAPGQGSRVQGTAEQLNVGDSFEVEIKTGLRRIHGTAVVRNVTPTGSGVEFVHMKQDDREKLRRLVKQLARD